MAFANGYAATMDFVGAESVKVVADLVQVSQRWMVLFGIHFGAPQHRHAPKSPL